MTFLGVKLFSSVQFQTTFTLLSRKNFTSLGNPVVQSSCGFVYVQDKYTRVFCFVLMPCVTYDTSCS